MQICRIARWQTKRCHLKCCGTSSVSQCCISSIGSALLEIFECLSSPQSSEQSLSLNYPLTLIPQQLSSDRIVFYPETNWNWNVPIPISISISICNKSDFRSDRHKYYLLSFRSMCYFRSVAYDLFRCSPMFRGSLRPRRRRRQQHVHPVFSGSTPFLRRDVDQQVNRPRRVTCNAWNLFSLP